MSDAFQRRAGASLRQFLELAMETRDRLFDSLIHPSRELKSWMSVNELSLSSDTR